jgi:hypothetical protein
MLRRKIQLTHDRCSNLSRRVEESHLDSLRSSVASLLLYHADARNTCLAALGVPTWLDLLHSLKFKLTSLASHMLNWGFGDELGVVVLKLIMLRPSCFSRFREPKPVPQPFSGGGTSRAIRSARDERQGWWPMP